MKNILVGNGINIMLAGHLYTNDGILQRLKDNIKNKDYNSVIKGIPSEEYVYIMESFSGKIHRLVYNGKYDHCAISDIEKRALDKYKDDYNYIQAFSKIGFEDYFLLMRLFNNNYLDANDSPLSPKEIEQAGAIGLQTLFTDAIFNEGDIQKLTLDGQIGSKTKKTLVKIFAQYDNIFTLNYDNNIENLTDTEVYKLHGSFDSLLNQYQSDSLMNEFSKALGVSTDYDDNLSHIYSNVIMGFSGEEKLQRVLKYNNIYDKNKEIGLFPKDLSHTKYPIKQFLKMEGELDIVGMSPNNDSHIWDMIKRSKINKIIYYARDKWQEDYVKENLDELNIDVDYIDDKWKKLIK